MADKIDNRIYLKAFDIDPHALTNRITPKEKLVNNFRLSANRRDTRVVSKFLSNVRALIELFLDSLYLCMSNAFNEFKTIASLKISL